MLLLFFVYVDFTMKLHVDKNITKTKKINNSEQTFHKETENNGQFKTKPLNKITLAKMLQTQHKQNGMAFYKSNPIHM
jgi:hypothetical protein